jgi:Gram-negative bacterial TonB protein C-terminal
VGERPKPHYRVLSGHSLLVQSAIDAIRQWKFHPNVVQGQATWSRIRAVVRFNTDGTTAVDLAPAILPDDFGNPGIPATDSAANTILSSAAMPRPPTAPACINLRQLLEAQVEQLEAAEVGPGTYIIGTNTLA